MIARVARRLGCLVLLGAFGLAAGASPAAAIVFQSTTAQTAGLGAGQSFLDGEAELIVSYNDNTQGGCSGSLLAGGSYVLTAAHCVTGGNDTLTATGVSIFFRNVGLTVATSSYVVDPVWNGSLQNGGDLALLSLATPVTSIAGYQLDLTSSALGKTVTLAGYGLTGTGTTGAQQNTFGTLYYGTNFYLGTYPDIPSVYDFGFAAMGRAATMIAPGDSGGGSFVFSNGTWQLVGVHDFISCSTPNCTPDSTFGNMGGDTAVYADAAFLAVAVPEPGTAPLVAGWVAALVVAVRRRAGRRRR